MSMLGMCITLYYNVLVAKKATQKWLLLILGKGLNPCCHVQNQDVAGAGAMLPD